MNTLQKAGEPSVHGFSDLISVLSMKKLNFIVKIEILSINQYFKYGWALFGPKLKMAPFENG